MAAHALLAGGCRLVDVRTREQRRAGGVVPGGLWVPRNVLEWRAEPGSEWAHPLLRSAPPPLIVMCAEGYQSVLATANLVDMGVAAVDLAGGFAAWVEAGLPVAASRDPAGAGSHERLGVDP